MRVELADGGDLAAVMNVLDGADLEVSAGSVRTAIGREAVFVARSSAGTVLGALVGESRRSPVRIRAVAVRPGRRGQGVGSALIEAASDRWTDLTAAFDSELAPFYRALGFEIERLTDAPGTGDRFVARLRSGNGNQSARE